MTPFTRVGAADYSSTAFWYGDTAADQTTTDTLNIGDTTNESSHAYTSGRPGAIRAADLHGLAGTGSGRPRRGMERRDLAR
jgi:hypothetical protein